MADIELTDDEQEAGMIAVQLLPTQAEILNELLAPRGFEISPPVDLGEAGVIRFLRMKDPWAHGARPAP
jgi:hypothetical protein